MQGEQRSYQEADPQNTKKHGKERDENLVESSFLVLSLYISVSGTTNTYPTTTFTPQEKKSILIFARIRWLAFFPSESYIPS